VIGAHVICQPVLDPIAPGTVHRAGVFGFNPDIADISAAQGAFHRRVQRNNDDVVLVLETGRAFHRQHSYHLEAFAVYLYRAAYRIVAAEEIYGRGLADDGEAALDSYRKALGTDQPYAVVIMDLTIRGGMGGKETIGQLLALDPKAKVIVSSGYDNNPVIAEYAAYGFSGVLAKPYGIDEVSRVLDRLQSP